MFLGIVATSGYVAGLTFAGFVVVVAVIVLAAIRVTVAASACGVTLYDGG